MNVYNIGLVTKLQFCPSSCFRDLTPLCYASKQDTINRVASSIQYLILRKFSLNTRSGLFNCIPNTKHKSILIAVKTESWILYLWILTFAYYDIVFPICRCITHITELTQLTPQRIQYAIPNPPFTSGFRLTDKCSLRLSLYLFSNGNWSKLLKSFVDLTRVLVLLEKS